MRFLRAKSFKKAIARLTNRQIDAVDAAIALYEQDRRHPTLRDHALKGTMKGLRSFSAGWDLRVSYREEGGFITIILVDVESHKLLWPASGPAKRI
jgi:mRNA-degrading endonuclease YafQ of YafQ-DinJ toxin-antitoxin module